ncbi:MAG TPA: hypothetical protein VGM96_27600 [Reyranella sp.]
MVDISLDGAQIQDGDNETIKSLRLNGGLNVANGGKLTVTQDITNTGKQLSYFINDGTVIVQDGVDVGTVANTYDDRGDANPDNDWSGYIANTGKFVANLDNSGSVINGGDGSDPDRVIWLGNVSNAATGFIDNNGGTWRGIVTDNAGGIWNEYQSSWIGDVQSNDGDIENDGGSTWQGDIAGNNGTINNIEGSRWTGDITANTGSINNDGGTWKGNVRSNDGVIWNTAGSVWKGDMRNRSDGYLELSGVVQGNIDNRGEIDVSGRLSGIERLRSSGLLNMQNDVAGDTMSAQDWFGRGSATLEFSPTLGRADQVVLSGTYGAHTDLDIEFVGSDQGRAYVDMPLIIAKGGVTGDITPNFAPPPDGVISYRLVQSAQGWTIATTLSDAPAHVASAMQTIGRSLASATEVSAHRGDACGSGFWARALGGQQSGEMLGARSAVGIGGVQVGYDLTCLALPGTDAMLDVGVTTGGVGGRVNENFGGDTLEGDYAQGFAGVYGNLVAGSLRAALQGQLSLGGIDVSDPSSMLDGATLSSTRLDLSGSASYELAFGMVSLTPELGFAASNTTARSTDFADVGGMSIGSGPVFDGHVGATLAVHMELPDGATIFTPRVSLSLHDEVSSGEALFTDFAGGSADVPLAALGGYAAIGLGADLVRSPGADGSGLGAGVEADFKLGPKVAEHGFSGYAQVKF